MGIFRDFAQGTLYSFAVRERKGLNEELDKINKLIHWCVIEKELKKIYKANTGRPAYSPIILFKILLLQNWFNMSDETSEKFISDRLSFRRFIGIDIDVEAPDSTTISHFRRRLINNNFHDKLLEIINKELYELNLFIKKETLVDSTFVKANAKKPFRNEETDKPGTSDVDEEARFGKKGFGYQAHTSIDNKSNLIKKSILKPANINDEKMLKEVLSEDDESVYADKVYGNKENRELLKERNIKERLMRKNYRNRKLTKHEIKRNGLISPVRSKIEKIFGTMKRVYKYERVRYTNIKANQLQLSCICICCNLRRALKLTESAVSFT